MCGIADVLDRRSHLLRKEMCALAASLAGDIEHRGPDDHGIWASADDCCAFAHGHLSILDCGRTGHYPMTNEGSALETQSDITVTLSGDSGGELFGGYNRYFNTWDEERRHGAGDRSLDWWRLGKVISATASSSFPKTRSRRRWARRLSGCAGSLARKGWQLEADERPLINVLRESDACGYLPGVVLAKVDRMSMWYSLEVRASLLGCEVAFFAAGLAADCYDVQRVLRCIAERFPSEAGVERPTRGFSIPIRRWQQSMMMLELSKLRLSGKPARWVYRRRAYRRLPRPARRRVQPLQGLDLLRPLSLAADARCCRGVSFKAKVSA